MIPIGEAVRRGLAPSYIQLYKLVRSGRVKSEWRKKEGRKGSNTWVEADDIQPALEAERTGKVVSSWNKRTWSAPHREYNYNKKAKKAAKAGQRKRRVYSYGLTADDLVEIGRTFNRTTTARKLSKRFGVPVAHIYSLASRMRKQGVDIPRFGKNGGNDGALKEAIMRLKETQPTATKYGGYIQAQPSRIG